MSKKGGGSKRPAQNEVENAQNGAGDSSSEDLDKDPDDFVPLRPGEQQDPKERLQIRREYSKMREEAQANRHDLIKPGSDGLHHTLKRTEQLFKNVRETREAVMDSQLVALISQLAKQQAQALHTDFKVFEPVEFAEKLITLVGGHELPDEERRKARLSRDGWIKLGEASQPFFKRSPALHCMLGTFERGPPKQKPAGSRQARKPDAVEKGPTQPKELTSFQETEKNEVTTVEVEKMLKVLQRTYQRNGRKPICYFEFVVNPHSFGLTIENMFYASFLIRDSCARIFLDEEKLPVIEPIENRDDPDLGHLPPRQQVIVTLDQKDYKEIVETFNITEPLIKPRERVTGGSSSAKKPKNR